MAATRKELQEAVICEPLRTPVGRYGGMFKDVPAAQLAETVLTELVRRTKIDPSVIDATWRLTTAPRK